MTIIPFRMNGLVLMAAAVLFITPTGLSAAEVEPLDRVLANKAGGAENSPSRRLQRSRQAKPEGESAEKKEVLEEKGIKQTWLAEKLGRSFCIVNSYVCNRRQPSLEVLFEIADILQVNPKDLIDGK